MQLFGCKLRPARRKLIRRGKNESQKRRRGGGGGDRNAQYISLHNSEETFRIVLGKKESKDPRPVYRRRGIKLKLPKGQNLFNNPCPLIQWLHDKQQQQEIGLLQQHEKSKV